MSELTRLGIRSDYAVLPVRGEVITSEHVRKLMEQEVFDVLGICCSREKSGTIDSARFIFNAAPLEKCHDQHLPDQ